MHSLGNLFLNMENFILSPKNGPNLLNMVETGAFTVEEFLFGSSKWRID